MQRPTHKELSKKLRQANAFVKAGQVILLDQVVLAAGALELDYSIELELLEVP